MANVLRESVGVTKITKRILDLEVSLTVGELLASAPGIEKLLTKALSEDEVVQFRMNDSEVAAVSEVSLKCQWYTIGCLKTRVRLKDSAKVLALLDTNAEINLMTKAVMEEAGLAIRSGSRLELISHTGHFQSFLGLFEDVEVAVGGLKTRHPIFVMEKAEHDLILGQPCLTNVKFTQEYQADRVFGTITNESEFQSAVFQTLAANDPSNRTKSDIFPSLN